MPIPQNGQTQTIRWNIASLDLKITKSSLDQKITFSLQHGKSLSIVHPSLVLKSS